MRDESCKKPMLWIQRIKTTPLTHLRVRGVCCFICQNAESVCTDYSSTISASGALFLTLSMPFSQLALAL